MTNVVIKEKLKNFNMAYNHPSYELEVKLIEEMKLCLYQDAHKTLNQINQLEQPVYSTVPLRSKKISLITWCSVFANGATGAGLPFQLVTEIRDLEVHFIDDVTSLNVLIGYEYKLLKRFIDLILAYYSDTKTYPVSSIIRQVYSNKTDDLTVANITKSYNQNPDYLTKLFKAELGMPISTYIQKHKIKLSKHYLKFSDYSISTIARELDFCNSGYFSKLFKKHTGTSPLNYKRSVLN